MGLFDNLRGLGKRRLGIELGREVSVVEIKGDSELTVAARAPRGGAVGAELGVWLRRWLDSLGVQAKSASAVLVDGDIQHHLLTLPEMKDAERHLAVGAEVRKLSSVPAQQIAYSQTPVGDIEESGVAKQRVLVSVIDKSTVRNAEAAFEAAGLELESLTTVPPALIEVARRSEDLAGGVALAWLSSDRCYLAVLRDGVLELVRDFRLRDAADAEEAFEPLAAELRRSFLFFTQRVHGASVDRLRLAGPLQGIERLLGPLGEALEVDADLLHTDAVAGDRHGADLASTAGLVAAVGAGSLRAGTRSNLRAPEDVSEERLGRWMSVGRLAAAIVLVVLIGWGLLAWLDGRVTGQRADRAQARLAAVSAELEDARRFAEARAAHVARREVLEDRALESSLLGTFLQTVSRSIDEPVVLQQVLLTNLTGPAGQTYWDAQLTGLVLGASRSESQSVFNRFYSRLGSSVVVDSMHLVEPLVIGSEDARPESPLVEAMRRGPVVRSREGDPREATRRLAPGQVEVRTTLDDLPPFGPTETSVGFKVAVELKAIDAGGSR